IGGIAIAFALQNVLTDIFASFSIYFDKPFRVGDTIQIGTDTGTVKRIGIKSTRIETLQGQELIVSNKELTTSRINNFKKMSRRRFAFTFNVSYDAPSAKLRKIPQIISEIIKKNKDTDIERVHLKQLGDTALVFEASYTIKNPDMKTFMDVQQEINFEIMERFKKENIKFARVALPQKPF
ncbi:MAG: mechanosensitive ion channel family protein, partial [Nanoarchaeota archaeon]